MLFEQPLEAVSAARLCGASGRSFLERDEARAGCPWPVQGRRAGAPDGVGAGMEEGPGAGEDLGFHAEDWEAMGDSARRVDMRPLIRTLS